LVPVWQLVAETHATGASTPPRPIPNADTLAELDSETYTLVAPAPAGTTTPSANKLSTPATNSTHRRCERRRPRSLRNPMHLTNTPTTLLDHPRVSNPTTLRAKEQRDWRGRSGSLVVSLSSLAVDDRRA